MGTHSDEMEGSLKNNRNVFSESVSFQHIVPTTKRSCRKETLILTYVTRYEALKRILVILYFFKVMVTAMVMNHL